ncbi:carboxypeptidase-like regulatory domain-containing protein [Chitinophagaceae bacterium LWZ2-11]
MQQIMKSVAFFILAIIVFYTGFGQTIHIHGTVIDADSKRNLRGVSVTVGETGTITDSMGHFNLHVQSSALKQTGITFSYVSYTSQKVYNTSSDVYNIELTPTYVELPEVTLLGSGLTILKKAISLVPQNYPQSAYQSTGVMRLQYLRNNSDFFNSDALVQIYIPSITGGKTASVKVLQNHIDTITDKSLIFIKWIGGYLSPVHADFIKNKEPFIDLKKMKKFRYQLMGKQTYHNRTSFVINFSQNDSSGKQGATAGTLFIDSATYAFAGADISYYNLTKYGTLPKSKLQYHMRYVLLYNKWYLQESFMKGNTIYKHENPTTLTDYVTVKIDTTNLTPYGYTDIVQEDDVTQRIVKPGSSSQLEHINESLQNSERFNELIKFSDLDTIKVHNAVNRQKGNNRLNYFTQDNFRYSLSFIRFPLQLNDPDHTKSDFVNYGFQIGTYFRIYRGLFFGFEGSGNTGTGKTVISLYAFHLFYDMNVTALGRSVILSPFFGYDLLTINQKADELKGHANYLIYGLKGAFELSHHVFLSASIGISDMTLKGESNFLPANFTPTVGVLIKN